MSPTPGLFLQKRVISEIATMDIFIEYPQGIHLPPDAAKTQMAWKHQAIAVYLLAES